MKKGYIIPHTPNHRIKLNKPSWHQTRYHRAATNVAYSVAISSGGRMAVFRDAEALFVYQIDRYLD